MFYVHSTIVYLTQLYPFLYLDLPHFRIWMQWSRIRQHSGEVLVLAFASPCVPYQYLPSFDPGQTPLPFHPRFYLFNLPSLLYCLFPFSTSLSLMLLWRIWYHKYWHPILCLVTYLGPFWPSSLSDATSEFLWRRWAHCSNAFERQESVRVITIVSLGSVWYIIRNLRRYTSPQLSVRGWSRAINHLYTSRYLPISVLTLSSPSPGCRISVSSRSVAFFLGLLSLRDSFDPANVSLTSWRWEL